MKKFLLIILSFVSISVQANQLIMKLHGDYPAAQKGEKLFLICKGKCVDSAIVKNKKFTFKLTNLSPDEYLITRVGKEGRRESMLLYLDYVDTYVKLERETDNMFNSYFIKNTVTGNPTHAVVSEINDIIMKGTGKHPAEDSMIKNKLINAVERKDMAAAILLWKYSSLYTYIVAPDKLRIYVYELPDYVKQTSIGQQVMTTYEKLFNLIPGGQAPDFTMNTPEGAELTLSTFLKGKKLVLIDFWASWCAPCRKKNPELVALYNKFHDKGLDVLSVSLDIDANRWKKAIEVDKLPWAHVSELKGWKSNICNLYNFNAVPALFLLDGNGKVLASGHDLDKELSIYIEKYCN
ncbi:MAG: TlpA disulfide reductase family protein [Lacibacter sp.]